MELHWAEGHITLARPEDFKSFKVVVIGSEHLFAETARDFADIARFVDRTLCWVSQAGLRTVAGPAATPAWLASVEAMVAKARPHGWIDEATGDIRAHVEWRERAGQP